MLHLFVRNKRDRNSMIMERMERKSNWVCHSLSIQHQNGAEGGGFQRFLVIGQTFWKKYTDIRKRSICRCLSILQKGLKPRSFRFFNVKRRSKADFSFIFSATSAVTTTGKHPGHKSSCSGWCLAFLISDSCLICLKSIQYAVWPLITKILG